MHNGNDNNLNTSNLDYSIYEGHLEYKFFNQLKNMNLPKDEIFLLDEFINRHKADTSNSVYDHPIYSEIFKILYNKKLTVLEDNNLDHLNLLKILQAVRLLSRNKNILKELLNETTLLLYEGLLDKLSKTKPKSVEAIDNIRIEIISIAKRFLNSSVLEQNKEFHHKILNSNLIDNLIFLLRENNLIILKSLHVILLSLMENKIKNYEKVEKEILLKSLYIVQIIYKHEETLGDRDSTLMAILFKILSTNEIDQQLNKQILTLLSAFSLNDDLNILIRVNWLNLLVQTLLKHFFRLREASETEKSLLIVNQTLIVRILRLIFSLEKNRKYFKTLLPTKLLSVFIDIGNYKHSLNLYSTFISELNSLTEEEAHEIISKSETISEDLPLTQTIGGYNIIELIGKGGFGSVYKVKCGNQKFAMKEVPLEESEYKRLKGDTSTKNIERVISEVHLWKDLDHPNIVKYYTSFMEKARNVYIVMELVEGINLSDYVAGVKEKGTNVKEKDILKILIDIVCGIKFLHKEKRVLYRDVNPHNVLLDNCLGVKLADFGLATRIQVSKEDSSEESLTHEDNTGNTHTQNQNSDEENEGKSVLSHSMSNAFVGSILYSSPELIKNEKYTEKSDLWSLGCILYELMKLQPPFEGDNPLTVAKNVVELNYKKLNPNEWEHPVLVYITERCLVLDPNERIDINEICGYLGPYFADKLNYFKRSEWELRNENENLNEKLYKLETAFTTNMQNANFGNAQLNGTTTNNLVQIENETISNQNCNVNSALPNSYRKLSGNTATLSKTKSDVFKQSNFKLISDPMTKILEMINKIIFLTSDLNVTNLKDEKFILINKFKRKLFSSETHTNRANIIKTEIMKLLNFSKETILFEIEDSRESREQPLNLTGMKSENTNYNNYTNYKSKITYEIMCHYIEELVNLKK